MNTLKPKLFLFGGCDLHDIAKNDLLQRDFDVIDFAINKHEVDNAAIDFKQSSFPEMGTSVMSLYTKPGPIAQRVLENLATGRKRDMIINRPVYNEIVKFPYLDFYKKNAGPNDYLLISFSPEIYTKCVIAGEIFTCLPAMHILENPENKLHWIYKEYFQKEEFLMPFDTQENIEPTGQIMVDFARDLYEIFQDRVLLVKTHFSNFVMSSDFKINKIKPGPQQLMFYRQTKIITDPTDHTYAERLSMIIMNKFKNRYKAKLKLIKLNEPVFIDANHRWGTSQFHLEFGSRNKIAKLIREELAQKIIAASTVNNG
jgi:hypothetical protein